MKTLKDVVTKAHKLIRSLDFGALICSEFFVHFLIMSS